MGAAVGSCSTAGLWGDRDVRGSGDIVCSHHDDDTDATASVAELHVAHALRGYNQMQTNNNDNNKANNF